MTVTEASFFYGLGLGHHPRLMQKKLVLSVGLCKKILKGNREGCFDYLSIIEVNNLCWVRLQAILLDRYTNIGR